MFLSNSELYTGRLLVVKEVASCYSLQDGQTHFNSHQCMYCTYKQTCVIRVSSQKDTWLAGWGGPRRDGRFMSAPKERREKKEGQEKQDLHKRVWMDIEDGWHLTQTHARTHIHSPTSALPGSESTKEMG